MNDEARRIAEVLEIAAPEQASADELHQWVSWWKASYEAARALSDEQRHSFKSGGWWPPVSAAQIENSPPDIVYVVFQLAEVAVPRSLFAEILRRIGRLRGSPVPAT